MIKNFMKNKNVKNAGWLIFGKIIQMGINFFVGILTARYLGPGNYGLINYAAAYTAFFFSICTLGINSIIVKEFIDNPSEEGKILGTSLILRGLSSVFSAIVIIGISFILDSNEPITKTVVILYTFSLIFQIFDMFNYWFQSRLQAKYTAIASLIAYSITAIYKIVLLITGQPVTLFALSMSIDYISIALILFYFYKKEGGSKLSFSLKYGKLLLKKSYHFILPGLMVAIYGQTDKMMLKHMINEAEIGYYATAVSLCSVWCFILSAIIDSMNPTIMKLYQENEKNFIKYNKILYFIVFYISIIVSIIFTIFGKLIIQILFGEAYLPTVTPLRIITWYTAFSYLGVARNAWVVCKDKQRYLKYLYCSSAILNVILNLIFIPKYGAVGAAFASLISQISTVIIVPFFIKELRENSMMIIEAILFRGIKNFI